jgi:hypothetical protein
MARSLLLLLADEDASPLPEKDGEQSMKVFVAYTPAALLLLLIFANFSFVNAQADGRDIRDSIYRIPAGTRMKLKLDAEINSRVSSVNDTFVATLTEPVMIREVAVLPKGTIVEGRVVTSQPAGLGIKPGTLDVTFEILRLAGDETRQIDGRMLGTTSVKSSRRFAAFSILGGAIGGAAIGAASKSTARSLIGAGVGGGAGAAIALSRRGNEARIAKDEEFEIELKREVILPVLDH